MTHPGGASSARELLSLRPALGQASWLSAWMLLGAVLSLVGAAVALLLVREQEIDREPVADEVEARDGELAVEPARA